MLQVIKLSMNIYFIFYRYPIKHPTVYMGDKCPDVAQIFGLIKCRILPPKKLYHPVLPFHLDKKSMYFLCLACATEQNQKTCNHKDADRSFIGTWVSSEVQLALVKGYRILKLIEVIFCTF